MIETTNNKSELNYLIEIIRNILYNSPFSLPSSNFSWERFFRIVCINGFESLVYGKLKDIPEVPAHLKENLGGRYRESICRGIRQEYYAEEILSCFERNEIKCLPLKGIVLRNLYPDPTMRSMTDLDILVDINRLEDTRKLMTQLGFSVYRYDTHHDIYRINPRINVELHKMLIVGEMENYFQTGFEKAHLKEGYSYIYEMSKEDFYIHMLGHMAYHFAHGGVGIRLVLDIRIYLDKYEEILDWDYLEKELNQVGLFAFSVHIRKLSAIWFCKEKSNDFYDRLGDFIVESGYLGSKKHSALLEVAKQDKNDGWNARKKAAFNAIFPSLKTMAFSYPVLNKYPFLLPVMWGFRWGTILFTRRKNLSRLQRILKADKMEVWQVGDICDKLGIRHLL